MSRPGTIAVFSVLGVLVVTMTVLISWGSYSVSIRTEEAIILKVRPGETLRHFAGRLGKDGVLRNPSMFILLGILRGDSGKIKAGEYIVEGEISPTRLLDDLVSARARFVSLTIPEGFSLKDIAGRIEQKKLGDGKKFIKLARDPEFIASLGLPFGENLTVLEGLVYPDTYYFHPGTSESQLLATMVREFKKKAANLLRDNSAKVGLTPYKTLILASIIEKETGVGRERPLISAVFHNRLRARMRLGSDPTVIYGIPKFDGNLKRIHLRTRTPYNTYRIQGLPPTPIANPGLGSIRAALEPAKVDFLYFVSKGDGTHFFSKDYRTHNKAVFKYQVAPYRRKKS